MPNPRIRQRKDGSIYHQVRYRHDGFETSSSFDYEPEARRFCDLIERFGVAVAVDSVTAKRAVENELTLAEWFEFHIDALTGVQQGTKHKYRRIARTDFAEMGALPLSAVTPETVGKWVQAHESEGAAGKTIADKHGLLSAA